MNFRQTKTTALYERLSRDDEQFGDSNSIINQKKLLEEYASQHGYENIVHYTDDGYSGGSFERPDWKRMIDDIELGKISTVIAKDMSRIGRNYLEVGYYTEVLFAQKNIRFIAVANGIDSDNQSSSEFTPFLNVMNEWYLRDCSKKIKASKRILGNSGGHLSAFALYGYKKDPNDKHKWLIDEEAASVVKRMFNLVIEGYGTTQIASIFSKDKIETPSYYNAKNGNGRYKNKLEDLNPYSWNSSTVKYLLTRQEYMGYTINFKTESKSYKEKKNIINTPDKWAVFPNTQEAIVDPETWYLVQKLLGTPRKKNELNETNPLTGLVFCADCGAKMYNQRVTEGISSSGKKRNAFEAYNCSNYKLKASGIECTNHHISTKDLKGIILFTIKEISAYAISNREEFAQKVYEASQIKKEQEVKELKAKLNRSKKRYNELNILYQKLYEAYALGRIPEDKFEMLSCQYLDEQNNLKPDISYTESFIEKIENENKNIDGFLSLAQKYTDFSELTAPMINEFIDKIIVHSPDRSNGPRTQEIEIYLKFIGNFDVPPREPTEEEIETEKVRKYWQDRYWNRREYELNRRKVENNKKSAEKAEIHRKEHEEKVSAALVEVRKQADAGELMFMPSVY